MDRLERNYWLTQLASYEEQYKEACYIEMISLGEAIKNIKAMLEA